MSQKLPFGLEYREFDVERDRQLLIVIWLLGALALVTGLVMLVSGWLESFRSLTVIGLTITLGSTNFFRVAIRTRRKIKAHDATSLAHDLPGQ